MWSAVSYCFDISFPSSYYNWMPFHILLGYVYMCLSMGNNYSNLLWLMLSPKVCALETCSLVWLWWDMGHLRGAGTHEWIIVIMGVSSLKRHVWCCLVLPFFRWPIDFGAPSLYSYECIKFLFIRNCPIFQSNTNGLNKTSYVF